MVFVAFFCKIPFFSYFHYSLGEEEDAEEGAAGESQG
jgi:hypothetical protein